MAKKDRAEAGKDSNDRPGKGTSGKDKSGKNKSGKGKNTSGKGKDSATASPAELRRARKQAKKARKVRKAIKKAREAARAAQAARLAEERTLMAAEEAQVRHDSVKARSRAVLIPGEAEESGVVPPRGVHGGSRRDAPAASRTETAEPVDAQPEQARSKGTARQKGSKKSAALDPGTLADLLRVGPDFDLAGVDPGATPGFTGDKDDAERVSASLTDELADLQERLYAHGTSGGSRSLLLIVQGMDTAGKGGIMRHVVGTMDPQGVRITAFKAPTREEKSKGYLWRIRQGLPAPGYVGVFDRSQYEDVLVARVRGLVPRSVWSRRYAGINSFESQQVNKGMSIVKVMLHISKEEQGERLAERIERPDKYWKYNPGDVDDRAFWPDYQDAYQDALVKCSTPSAPWFVVPADNKWYARLAVHHLVLGALRDLDLGWPPAHFDPEVERRRLADS